MPELPEVESARAAIERAALNRRINDVDDSDTYVCRPHAPGEIRAALVGRSLTAANRQGKSIWCDTSGLGRSHTPGPELAIHLGMSGHILVTYADGELTEGGDWLATEGAAGRRTEPEEPGLGPVHDHLRGRRSAAAVRPAPPGPGPPGREPRAARPGRAGDHAGGVP